MDKELIQNIINTLENVSARPVWYIGDSVDPYHVLTFFTGLYTGISLLIEKSHLSARLRKRHELASEMGLKSTSYIREWRELGYSDEEIIKKLLVLEIDTWEAIMLERFS